MERLLQRDASGSALTAPSVSTRNRLVVYVSASPHRATCRPYVMPRCCAPGSRHGLRPVLLFTCVLR